MPAMRCEFWGFCTAAGNIRRNSGARRSEQRRLWGVGMRGLNPLWRRLMCSRCGEPHERAGQRYCSSCHAATMRAWRARRVTVPVELINQLVERAEAA